MFYISRKEQVSLYIYLLLCINILKYTKLYKIIKKIQKYTKMYKNILNILKNIQKYAKINQNIQNNLKYQYFHF